MGGEAIESSMREVVRREGSIPSPTYQTFRPDIIGKEEIKQVDQDFDRQLVERITCIGYQALNKALFSPAERADKAGKAGQRSAVSSMPGMLDILRCIALAQWEVEVGLEQGMSHCAGCQ